MFRLKWNVDRKEEEEGGPYYEIIIRSVDLSIKTTKNIVSKLKWNLPSHSVETIDI